MLCEWLWTDKNIKCKLTFLKNKICEIAKFTNLNETQSKVLKLQIEKFFLWSFSKFWNKCHRKKLIFAQKYEKWMNSVVCFNCTEKQAHKKKRGRQLVPFDQASDRSNRRTSQRIRKQYTQVGKYSINFKLCVLV